MKDVTSAHVHILMGLNFSFLPSLRLSYQYRIAEVVPEQFDCFVPQKPEPVYKFSAESTGTFIISLLLELEKPF